MPGREFLSPGWGFEREDYEAATYDLGKSFRGFSVGNVVTFRARPKGIKCQPIQWLEGVIRRIERRWGEEFVSVRGHDDQTYDVRLREAVIADAVTEVVKLTNADNVDCSGLRPMWCLLHRRLR